MPAEYEEIRKAVRNTAKGEAFAVRRTLPEQALERNLRSNPKVLDQTGKSLIGFEYISNMVT